MALRSALREDELQQASWQGGTTQGGDAAGSDERGGDGIHYQWIRSREREDEGSV